MDRFEQVMNAIGNDDIHTNLVVGSKDPMGGNDGNVGDLQRALNRLGAKPELKVDGKFGSKTKAAVLQLRYNYPVDANTFYKILSDANTPYASDTTVSESKLREIWKKLGSKKTFEEWLKSEKLKQVSSGIFSVAMGWLKAKQQQAGMPTGDDFAREDDNLIWGMHPAIVWGGGAVLAGLFVWGIVAASKRGQKVIIAQPAV